jgi:hypothetical protein
MEATNEMSDVEYIAFIEAREAEEFRLAVEAWRTEKQNGGGAAVILEVGGDFAQTADANADAPLPPDDDESESKGYHKPLSDEEGT